MLDRSHKGDHERRKPPTSFSSEQHPSPAPDSQTHNPKALHLTADTSSLDRIADLIEPQTQTLLEIVSLQTSQNQLLAKNERQLSTSNDRQTIILAKADAANVFHESTNGALDYANKQLSALVERHNTMRQVKSCVLMDISSIQNT